MRSAMMVITLDLDFRTLSNQTSGYCVMQPLSRSSSNVSSCCSGVRENETSEEEENETVSVGFMSPKIQRFPPPHTLGPPLLLLTPNTSCVLGPNRSTPVVSLTVGKWIKVCKVLQ